MGQSLASMIKSIDGDDDASRKTKESMEALFELGKSRNDAAWAQATSNAINTYAPINKVLIRRQSIVVNATPERDEIVTGIKSCVGKLISGQILDGVTDIIINALNIGLGSPSGQVSQNNTYALIATELGALLRIDTTSICSRFGLKSTANDLRSIVSMTFGSSPLERQKEIYDIIQAAWSETDRNDGRKGPSIMSLSGHNGNFDGGLSPEGRQRVQALFKPSVYEEQMTSRGLLVDGMPKNSAESEDGPSEP